MTWKMIARDSRVRVEAALIAQENAPEWDPEVVVTGYESDERHPEEWVLEAYVPRKPNTTDRRAVASLFADDPPKIAVERLADEDWVTASQQGVAPIRAGPFHVHTPDHAPRGEAGIIDFCIPASQAFGTGHHATTAGCLAMLSAMKRRGVHPRHIVDIGTGTGLLAFAALALWPGARGTASDIDPVCLPEIARNMAANGIAHGAGPGALTTLVADGADHPLLQARGPYDLLIANILAAPLIEMAGGFAELVPPRGSVLLAGLLTSQEAAVRRAYRLQGFRLAARLEKGDWSILWLRRRNAR